MAELLLLTGDSGWLATLLPRGGYLLTTPPGIAAPVLIQRLTGGSKTPGLELHWQPPLQCGLALLGGHATLLSNLQAWENIVLPQLFHEGELRKTAEHDLRRWLPELLGHPQDAELWLHRPVSLLTAGERQLAELLRAMLSPAEVVLLTRPWLDAVPASDRSRWLACLWREVQTQGRCLLIVGPEKAAAELQEQSLRDCLLPLEWQLQSMKGVD